MPHPSLLAHIIYRALQFDAALREERSELDGTLRDTVHKRDGVAAEAWPGVCDVILGKKEWFDANAPDAWQIVNDELDDVVVGHDLKTTKSARRLKALIEQTAGASNLRPDDHCPYSLVHLRSLLSTTKFPTSYTLPPLNADTAVRAILEPINIIFGCVRDPFFRSCSCSPRSLEC